MALNDGEREALLNQVISNVQACEKKIVALGLADAAVYVVDKTTGQRMTMQDVIAMAERRA